MTGKLPNSGPLWSHEHHGAAAAGGRSGAGDQQDGCLGPRTIKWCVNSPTFTDVLLLVLVRSSKLVHQLLFVDSSTYTNFLLLAMSGRINISNMEYARACAPGIADVDIDLQF